MRGQIARRHTDTVDGRHMGVEDNVAQSRQTAHRSLGEEFFEGQHDAYRVTRPGCRGFFRHANPQYRAGARGLIGGLISTRDLAGQTVMLPLLKYAARGELRASRNPRYSDDG